MFIQTSIIWINHTWSVTVVIDLYSLSSKNRELKQRQRWLQKQQLKSVFTLF